MLIINKSGGLIYHKSFPQGREVEESLKNDESGKKSVLNSNDLLILASTLHSVFAITSQITPKALQLSQSGSVNTSTIPYHPYVGVVNPQTTSIGKNDIPVRYGSFKGDDYFKEPFHTWNKSGLKELNTDQFTMYIYQTMTGLKFVAISSSALATTANNTSHTNYNNVASNSTNGIGSEIADNLLRKVYCVYSDYVMKDPFYSLEMPIKSNLFDDKVRSLIDNLL